VEAKNLLFYLMYKLRPYQQKAVDCVISFFRKKNEPAVIVLPTGAGKSLVISEMARVAKGRVLSLAHVKELVEQNHEKYVSYDLDAGIYSAGLNQKDVSNKVVFGSIQSVARASSNFFHDFSLLIIDECHRVNTDDDTQYSTVINKLKENNPNIKILGLTATPYRLGSGWIYEVNQNGEVKSEQSKFFKRCVFELPLSFMIKNKFLTQPVKVNIPVTCYDFSELTQTGKMYTTKEVEELINKQKRITPLIIKNIIDITESYNRKGVMIFSSTVNHAKEILNYLPEGDAKIILGNTDNLERDSIIQDFKDRKFKYLVNVSVLTTGFDAPHVDVIALLRPTESVSLYQQIIGRGLRLDEGKSDCFILDYAGIGYDIYTPEIGEKKPSEESEIVLVTCPSCDFENQFWGKITEDGDIVEHYGRKCRGVSVDNESQEVTKCGYLFRFKVCNQCGEQNDITARECKSCKAILIDPDAKLKQARLSKNAHVLKPDSMEFLERRDKKGNSFLEVRYYDFDAKYLSEFHYLNNPTSVKKFNINFLRSHWRRPEIAVDFDSPEQVVHYQKLLRVPSFVIARKQEKFWKITEKIFTEDFS
jgi:DNA repair protein RadD